MMLEYLYELETPEFLAGMPSPKENAEMAYILGDKYDLPKLQFAGYKFLLDHALICCKKWDAKDEAQKQAMVNWIKRIWSWKQQDSEKIRDRVLHQLSGMSASMLDYEPFQNLMWQNKEFGMDFVKALKKQVWKNHQY